MGKLGSKVNFPLLLTCVSCIALGSRWRFEIHPAGCKSENGSSRSNLVRISYAVKQFLMFYPQPQVFQTNSS